MRTEGVSSRIQEEGGDGEGAVCPMWRESWLCRHITVCIDARRSSLPLTSTTQAACTLRTTHYGARHICGAARGREHARTCCLRHRLLAAASLQQSRRQSWMLSVGARIQHHVHCVPHCARTAADTRMRAAGSQAHVPQRHTASI